MVHSLPVSKLSLPAVLSTILVSFARVLLFFTTEPRRREPAVLDDTKTKSVSVTDDDLDVTNFDGGDDDNVFELSDCEESGYRLSNDGTQNKEFRSEAVRDGISFVVDNAGTSDDTVN